MRISIATTADKEPWFALRCALWPEEDQQSLRDEINPMLADSENFVVFVARDDADAIVGFAEASLRQDYVNGCESSPVAFLEGIFVAPTHRRRGYARALVNAVAKWGRTKDVTEFASDALIDNVDSHRMHVALGFEVTERVIYFRKPL